MKLMRRHVISGVLDEDETKLILQNTLPNIGWRIVDVRCYPNTSGDVNRGVDAAKSIKVTTIDGSASADFIVLFEYDKNTTVGIASYDTGNQPNMFDDAVLITKELYVTNMNRQGASLNGGTGYQLVLEQYDITSDEEVLAVIRETAQAGQP